MTTPAAYTDADLNAYVDGELDEAARADMETWLAADPQAAARVAAYRRQNRELHQLFDGVLDEAAPAHLVDLVRASPSPTGRPVWRQIAASLALLLVGAAAGWGLHGQQKAPFMEGRPGYVERALGAHLVYAAEVLHPVEVEASQEKHLVAWLSKRLGAPLRAPQLGEVGFRLVGGRLLEEQGLPAAQFMYENDAGRRLTAYVRADQGQDTAFKFTGKDGLSAFYWIDAPFAYALSGDIGRAELLKVARLVYEGLDLAR